MAVTAARPHNAATRTDADREQWWAMPVKHRRQARVAQDARLPLNNRISLAPVTQIREAATRGPVRISTSTTISVSSTLSMPASGVRYLDVIEQLMSPD
jgi:hypothetical protein